MTRPKYIARCERVLIQNQIRWSQSKTWTFLPHNWTRFCSLKLLPHWVSHRQRPFHLHRSMGLRRSSRSDCYYSLFLHPLKIVVHHQPVKFRKWLTVAMVDAIHPTVASSRKYVAVTGMVMPKARVSHSLRVGPVKMKQPPFFVLRTPLACPIFLCICSSPRSDA